MVFGYFRHVLHACFENGGHMSHPMGTTGEVVGKEAEQAAPEVLPEQPEVEKHGETEAKEAKVSESREQKEDVADVVESQESVQEKDPKEQKEQKDELKNDELREVQKVEAELEHPDPKDGAKAQNPETDETDEADEAGSGGKDTETFQAARVHQARPNVDRAFVLGICRVPKTSKRFIKISSAQQP